VIQAGIKTLCSEIAKIEHYIWDKKELLQQIESVFVAVNNSVDKTDCSKYPDVVLLSG
jgi:hypothetical protein